MLGQLILWKLFYKTSTLKVSMTPSYIAAHLFRVWWIELSMRLVVWRLHFYFLNVSYLKQINSPFYEFPYHFLWFYIFKIFLKKLSNHHIEQTARLLKSCNITFRLKDSLSTLFIVSGSYVMFGNNPQLLKNPHFIKHVGSLKRPQRIYTFTSNTAILTSIATFNVILELRLRYGLETFFFSRWF